MSRDETPQEIIVVEGKSDTQKLQAIYGLDVRTIETNGSEISEAILDEIEKAHETYGAVVLTDPDYSGERIRRIIERRVPTIKHAYLKPSQAQSDRKGESLGLEHADAESIQAALAQSIHPVAADDQPEALSTYQLQALGLIGQADAKERRQYIAEKYHLGPMNGKQLKRKLQLYRISYQALLEALKEGGFDLGQRSKS